VQEWLDLLFVVCLVGRIDLGGDLELPFAPAGDLDGAIDALLRRGTSQERQVIALLAAKRELVLLQSVIDGPCQLSQGNGSRCESEMETTGTSGYSR